MRVVGDADPYDCTRNDVIYNKKIAHAHGRIISAPTSIPYLFTYPRGNQMKNNLIVNTILKSAVLKTAFCGVVLMLFFCAFLGITPFGDNTFLTGDLNGQYVNYFAQMRHAVLDGEGLEYNLQKSFGGSIVGIIAYYAASPFVLLYILFDPVFYGTLTTFVVISKVVLMCISMAFFLSRKLKTQDDKIILFSLAFGFSGYVFVYMQNFMWHDVLILLPLLCYGVDEIIEKKRPFIYIIALFAAVFTNFYIAYMVCIFLVLYFLYNVVVNKYSFKEIVGHGIRFSLASILGGLMSAVMLFPALADITASKGIGSGTTLTLTTEFAPHEFLARLVPFVFYWEYLIDDLPNVYSGLITLILSIAFFTAKNISLRQKLASLAVLLVLFLSMWSTDLMLLFHGFTYPVWFTHRHSFLFIFWICFLAANAFVRGSGSTKGLLITFFAVVSVLFARFVFDEPVFTLPRFAVVIFLVGVLFIALFIHVTAKSEKIKKLSILFMLFVLCGELLLNTYYSYVQFEQYPNSTYQTFVEEHEFLIDELKAQEGGDDFRLEKNYYRSLNDGLLLDYYGVTHFGSTQDRGAYDFVYNTNLSSGVPQSTYVSYGTSVFSDSLAGIKYLFTKPENAIPEGYLPTDLKRGDITVYENPYVFPLAFMLPDAESYDLEISTDEELTEQENNVKNVEQIYEILCGDADFAPLFFEDGAINLSAVEVLSEKFAENGATVDLSRGDLTAEITSSVDGVLYVSIPYNENLIVTVNGEEKAPQTVFNSMLGINLESGENYIEIKYATPMKNIGMAVSIICAVLVLVWFKAEKR